MRITHVVDFFHTDLLYQEYHLALQQARAGHDVHVVTSTRRQSGVGEASAAARAGQQALDEAGVTIHQLDSRDLGHDRIILHRLASTLDRIAPDALHCHQCFTPTTALVARWAGRRPVGLLCDSHLSALNSPAAVSTAGKAFYGTWRAVVAPWLRRRVGAFVVNGDPELQFLQQHLALPFDRIETIPLGFDTDRFAFDAARRARARARFGIAPTDTVVAVTGKITRERKSDHSLGAAERLAHDRSVQVLVAGSVGEGVVETWAAAAPTLSEQGRIHQLGMLAPDDLADCFLAADVTVYPFGSTISAYEALGTGLPVAVLAGDFGDYLAGLGIGATAVDVPTVDLRPLLLDERTRAQRAAAAAAEVGWPVLAQRFVDRYQDLAQEARAR